MFSTADSAAHTLVNITVMLNSNTKSHRHTSTNTHTLHSIEMFINCSDIHDQSSTNSQNLITAVNPDVNTSVSLSQL